MAMPRISKLVSLVSIVFAFATTAVLPPVAAQDDPKELIAVQVRDQGYKCDAPKSATKDEAITSPDEQGWILECEDATYKVKLVPDMAAEIEQIN